MLTAKLIGIFHDFTTVLELLLLLFVLGIEKKFYLTLQNSYTTRCNILEARY